MMKVVFAVQFYELCIPVQDICTSQDLYPVNYNCNFPHLLCPVIHGLARFLASRLVFNHSCLQKVQFD